MPDGCSGHILISHTHWDHIQGVPFFAPLFVEGAEWHIYGPRGLGHSIEEVLAGQMQSTYFPINLEQFEAKVDYRDLVEGCFEIGDIQVTARYLNHPALTLGYRLEADGAVVVYSTDHEPHSRDLAAGIGAQVLGEDKKHQEFLAGADLLIHDCQYMASEYADKIGWGHSTVEYATDAAIAAGVKHVALYHHDPLRDDDAIDALLATARERVAAANGTVEVSAATEGSMLELYGSQRRHDVPAYESGSGLAHPNAGQCALEVIIAVGDPETREILTIGAKEDGNIVQFAETAEAVLDLMQDEPALVVLGNDLPDAEPIETCRSIRKLPIADAKDLPIIVVADENGVDRAAEQDAGVTDWLVKPFKPAYAQTRMRAWVLRTLCRWIKAPLPPDEEDRLAALHKLEILDTPPEERFDRHTRIAAASFGSPIALVSLVDRDRQWFKSRHGLEATETSRDMAFCAHAILDEEPLVVSDALSDDRFADNPLVADDPAIRFYAGAPLRLLDGSRIGTLCVIDHRPRSMTETQIDLLKDLAKLVEQEFHVIEKDKAKD
jgi:ribonuclease BN (tRNA processing enzyme)/CheY-like chemotaxis protein